jgi:hypothetical protein
MSFVHAGSNVIAVNRVFSESMKGLPRNATGILNPPLISASVATGRILLLDDHLSGRIETLCDRCEILVRLNLKPQMVNSWSLRSRGNRKIDKRIFKHPFRVIGFEYSRLPAEQRRIKSNRRVEVGDMNVNVKSFHCDALLFRLETTAPPCALSNRRAVLPGIETHNSGRPPQQFSVRYAINAFIAS